MTERGTQVLYIGVGALLFALTTAALARGATAAASQAPTQSASQPSAQASSATPAQTPAPPAAQTSAQPAEKNAAEISTRDELTTFKVKVNLVEVRVVVRDAAGNTVGNLKQDDFLLLDNGKPQTVSRFAMEQLNKVTSTTEKPVEIFNDKLATQQVQPLPDHYVAYLFDDVHLSFGDLAQVRNAMVAHLKKMRPNERAAIYTTSAQTTQDFTDDVAKLTATMNKIMPRPIGMSAEQNCPNMNAYLADLIINQNDSQATLMATSDAINCAFGGDTTKQPMARALTQEMAMEVLGVSSQQARVTLSTMDAVVRRMSAMPGRRTIVFISPGFLNPQSQGMGHQQQDDVVERALRSNVLISALDARGLYTPVIFDASQSGHINPALAPFFAQYQLDESNALEDVMMEMTDATGGTFIHNTNAFEGGLTRLATAPEYSYMLAFTPQNLKLDGRFHSLKVKLKPPEQRLKIAARKGYFAPKQAADANEQAKREIEDAVFSQQEVRDIPVELHTQFFKSSEEDAQLSVVARMDVRRVHFRKEEGRNRNDLTIVSALFDRNGNFVQGQQKVLTMRLKDDTLQNRLGAGVTVRSSFDVKPGSYLVRLVVRDDEGEIAARSSAVEIP